MRYYNFEGMRVVTMDDESFNPTMLIYYTSKYEIGFGPYFVKSETGWSFSFAFGPMHLILKKENSSNGNA